MNFACQESLLNQDKNITAIAAICNKLGNWDPNPAEYCASGIINVKQPHPQAHSHLSNITHYIAVCKIGMDLEVRVHTLATVRLNYIVTLQFCFCHAVTNQRFVIIMAAAASSTAAVIITLVFSTICFCCGYFRRNQTHKVKKRKKPRPRKPTPPPKEFYYNLHAPLKQEQVPPKCPVAMYDDILPLSEQDLKQNIAKPKVMYDEVLPLSEQAPVELKKNTAYCPDSK